MQFLIEALKAGAPLLAVIIPAIAAFFVYRAAERKKPSVGQAGMMSIGGAFVDRDTTTQYVNAIESLVAVVENLTRAILTGVSENHRCNERLIQIVDAVTEMRRAMEEMVAVKRRGRDQQSRPRS